MTSNGSEACSDLKIPCLQSLADLELVCKKEGIKYNVASKRSNTDEYEVDLILEDAFERGIHWYLVKWKNYSVREATWEPAANLKGCDELLLSYHSSQDPIVKSPKDGKLTLRIFEKFIRTVTKKSFNDLGTLVKLGSLVGVNGISLEGPTTLAAILNMKKKLFELTTYSHKRLTKIAPDVLNIIKFYKDRMITLQKLKVWEDQVNEVMFPPVSVVNNVDCEGPPDFTFIRDYIFVGMSIQDDPLVGCECLDCFAENKCCPKLANEKFAYDKSSRLKLSPGYPIYECNTRCKCDSTCPNRVVQKGPQVKLEIFRTANSRGWGLRTMQRLRRGQFILEYIGEVITSEEAEQRRYDDGQSYLFDLDFDHNDCSYTVDAKQFGNAAHFINHSCDPNLHVFAVWINNLDPKLPRLAFFANRDIRYGEELTFDYRMNKETPLMQHSSPTNSPKKVNPSSSAKQVLDITKLKFRIHCLCGANNCRGFLF